MGKIRATATEPARVHYSIDSETDRILINWGKWCAARNGVRWKGQGVFRHAKSGQDWEAPTAAELSVLPLDSELGWRTERVICTPLFYPPYQTMLREHYVFRRDKRATCRLLALHYSAYDEELWKASCFFRNRFDH